MRGTSICKTCCLLNNGIEKAVSRVVCLLLIDPSVNLPLQGHKEGRVLISDNSQGVQGLIGSFRKCRVNNTIRRRLEDVDVSVPLALCIYLFNNLEIPLRPQNRDPDMSYGVL